MQIDKEVFGEEAMEGIGGVIASALTSGGVVYLSGDLGMGKTTLVRGMLYGLGYKGPVKSPTYTIVEPYELTNLDVYHFDLYRVANAEELEFMGIRDYFAENTLCLIEWAEMGLGVLPEADLIISLSLIRQGRHVSIKAQTQKGSAALSDLKNAMVL
ncbi:MAG: tRNA (adenosine(37)-N6)-threonylcarbamoyltransferase complex ATPase subunit type 1 TsaE [Marinomonas hwangdonensis]|nr:tRNA (adenosine(37)-N6)-threonylcarbamoyltransferase complex ATPase subunit type 1 TsaE [Marinomonas hwangdonensis]